MQVRKNKDNKELVQDFEILKKQAKEKSTIWKKANLLKMKFMSGFWRINNSKYIYISIDIML